MVGSGDWNFTCMSPDRTEGDYFPRATEKGLSGYAKRMDERI
jgi:hypothetical protein